MVKKTSRRFWWELRSLSTSLSILCPGSDFETSKVRLGLVIEDLGSFPSAPSNSTEGKGEPRERTAHAITQTRAHTQHSHNTLTHTQHTAWCSPISLPPQHSHTHPNLALILCQCHSQHSLEGHTCTWQQLLHAQTTAPVSR